jgi:putative endonuclease
MSNISRMLYTGVTNNLERRVYERQRILVPGFTKQYNITMLVYHETLSDPRSAIEREKEIKNWRRSKKIALIETMNPQWLDLSAGWFAE